MSVVSPHTLAVWAAEQRAGLLDRASVQRDYVFTYDLATANSSVAQVSLTMPLRLESWTSRDLHPIFQMNLPEGALLEAIRRAISKVAGEDDLTMLRVTGGNQVGRNRFSLAADSAPGIVESPESLEELLSYPDTEELFHELVAKYALRSGVSGVQPKVMLDASERGTTAVGGYIVKTWGDDYPQLAANEFFCMTAAQRAGLLVPEFHLSANGRLFVMKRFDVGVGGSALGFEDMCALQGVGTAQKYRSTYERVARSIKDFVSGEFLQAAREQFFAALVLSVMVRNGDAHLKNFGVLYDTPGAPVRLAPVYDVVTTTAYLPKDLPALSLVGTKKWWNRKLLEQFALAHLSLPVKKVSETIEKMGEAVSETRNLLIAYIAEHPEYQTIGERQLAAWEAGTGEFVK
ncbi:type II toxin-antitoxin system HipA family toxin [Trichlorobacter lovleyi]|uniref:HipA N-terminal domain protein n=1 Tax=Trichlorobacter lovleyi (strain ATCC BAA-1151 / DSM 17278 / SZ) TaxID=398767 RepID=B3EBV5_TRIL1|nr:type II toxin-antitoxin system HipA family toxin [Trichlorobacter lovleyi]ACD97387.1 HipA N-terminal domain protein [Trichlorobacter lovleyi SZ]